MPQSIQWWVFCLLLFACPHSFLAQPANPAGKPRNCSISGGVTISGKPAVNATVTLRPLEDEARGAIAAGATELFHAKAVTDAEGRYQLFNLPPGRWVVRAVSKAFLTGNADLFNSAEREMGGRLVMLEAGERRTDLDLEFVRGAVITGRVTDARGKPLVGEKVRLVAVKSESRLDRAEFGSASLDQGTDDRGVYRLFGVPAGRYLVCAGRGEIKGHEGVFSNLEQSDHQLTFHPSAMEPGKAKIIEVREGSEAVGIDLKLGEIDQPATFTVNGRVVVDETGKPLARKLELFTHAEQSGKHKYAYTDEQGAFRLAELPPGKYTMRVFVDRDLMGENQPNYFADETSFEVVDAEVNGVEVRLQRGAMLSGVVVVEGQENLQPAKRSLSINSEPLREEIGALPFEERNVASNRNVISANVEEDGRFVLTGLRAGRVAFAVRQNSVVNRQFKVLRIERNGTNLGRQVEIGGQAQITGLRVLVTPVNGVFHGQLSLLNGPLPKGHQLNVYVVSEEFGRREAAAGGGQVILQDEYLHRGAAPVAADGRFTLQDLMPGEYELRVNVYPSGPNDTALRFEETRHRISIRAQAENIVTIEVELRRQNR